MKKQTRQEDERQRQGGSDIHTGVGGAVERHVKHETAWPVSPRCLFSECFLTNAFKQIEHSRQKA